MLIVEDDEAIRILIADLLVEEGLTVMVASDGAEGIRHMLGRRPRVVLLDLVMPNVDGQTVTEYMRTIPSLAPIPIIPMTATPLPGALRKPFSIEALMKALTPHIPRLDEK